MICLVASTLEMLSLALEFLFDEARLRGGGSSLGRFGLGLGLQSGLGLGWANGRRKPSLIMKWALYPKPKPDLILFRPSLKFDSQSGKLEPISSLLTGGVEV